RRAPERVVEGRSHTPNAAEQTHLAQKQVGMNGEPMLPRRRNRVVAEDCFPQPQIAQPIAMPAPSATANSNQPTASAVVPPASRGARRARLGSGGSRLADGPQSSTRAPIPLS